MGTRDSLNTCDSLRSRPESNCWPLSRCTSESGNHCPTAKTCWARASLSQEPVRKDVTEPSATITPGKEGGGTRGGVSLPLLLGSHSDPVCIMQTKHRPRKSS